MDLKWLFEVTVSGTTYYWSSVATSWGGHTYESKIVAKTFTGITESRVSDESGLVNSSSLNFSIHSSPQSDSSFVDGTMTIRFVVDETQKRVWSLNIKRCETSYNEQKFYLESFITKYLIGDHPNTKQPRDIWPSVDPELEREDVYVIPQVFGSAYIPLRSVNTGSQRYYCLGSGSYNYDILQVSSPVDWGNQSEWDNTYAFNKTTTDGYRVFQAIIADSDEDLIVDANGLWKSGDFLLDMPTKFTSTEISVGSASPDVVISHVLQNFGVPSAMIDSTSFTSAASQYSTWGVTWDGGFYQQMDRSKRLSNLLSQCASTVRMTDKIELYPRSNVSQATFTISDVAKGSFKYSPIYADLSDGGYIEYINGDNTPQDRPTKIAVWSQPGQSTSADVLNPSSTVLSLLYIRDSVVAQKLGVLVFNRKLDKNGTCSFKLLPDVNHYSLYPDQVVTIDDSTYGSSKNVLIKTIKLNKDGSLELSCTQYEHGIIDFNGLTANNIIPSDGNEFAWENVTAIAPLIGISINVTDFDVPTNKYAYIHGYSVHGEPANTNGKISWNGSVLYVPKIEDGDNWTVKTSQAFEGYLMFDTTLSGKFIVDGGLHSVVFARKTSSDWFYDDGAGWTAFIPTNTDTVIGTMSAGASLINSANVFPYGQEPSSVVDSVDGATGVDSRTVNLTAVTMGFAYGEDGTTPVPATSIMTATALNNTGEVWYEFFLNDVSQINSTSDTWTYTPQADYNVMPDKVEVHIRELSGTGDILARDQVTMVGMRAGSDAVTLLITNEAHTLPKSSEDVVTYTGSGTDIKCWIGVTPIPYRTGSLGFQITATGTNVTPDPTPTIVDTYIRRFADCSAMITDLASIDFEITVKKADGTELVFNKLQSLSKTKQGADGTKGLDGDSGLNTATIYLYVRSATAPTLPTTSETYTFSTGALTTPDQGWTQEVPTTDGNPLWVTTAVATATAPIDTDTIDSGDWSGATKMAEDGLDGTDGVTSSLTNDSMVVSTYSDGTGGNYTSPNTESTMQVFVGSTLQTGWTFSRVNSTGVSSTIDTGTGVLDITGLTEDSGYVDITATKLGYSNQEKTVTIAKSKTGEGGDPLVSRWVTSSIGAIGKDVDNIYNPTTITFSAWEQSGSDTPTAFTGGMRIYENTTLLFSGGVSSKVYIPSSPIGIESITCELYTTTSYTDLLDTEAVPIVLDGATGDDGTDGDDGDDGADGLNQATIYLYQRASSAPANTDIDDQVYTFATGTLVGDKGAWLVSIPNGTNPLYAVAASAISDQPTDTILTAEWTSPVVMAQDGSAGTNGRSVNILSTDLSFTYDTGGALSPASQPATITATAHNYEGTPYFKFIVDGIEEQHTDSNTYTYNPTATISGMPESIAVELREDGTSGDALATDEISMLPLQESSDAITIVVTNEAHTLPTTNTGTVTYTGSGTDIECWIGATQVPYSAASPGFQISTSDTNINIGSASTINTYTRNFADASGMTADLASITFTITVKNSAGESVIITKTQSLAKSTQGSDGEDGEDGEDGDIGPDGPVGPGLIYRGPFTAGYYYYTSTRRDVIYYGGYYYLYNVASGSSGNYESSYLEADWTLFSTTFSTVATELLLAEDAAITKNLYVGGGTGSNYAGMSGVGTSSTSVRLWCGSASRDSAPFRVLNNGTFYATNAYISGTIGSGSSYTGNTISESYTEADANTINAGDGLGTLDSTANTKLGTIDSYADNTSDNETFSSESDINCLNTTYGPADANATQGSTWGNDISGQPSDNDLLNENTTGEDLTSGVINTGSGKLEIDLNNSIIYCQGYGSTSFIKYYSSTGIAISAGSSYINVTTTQVKINDNAGNTLVMDSNGIILTEDLGGELKLSGNGDVSLKASGGEGISVDTSANEIIFDNGQDLLYYEDTGSYSALRPATDSDTDLGLTTNYFRTAYIDSGNITTVYTDKVYFDGGSTTGSDYIDTYYYSPRDWMAFYVDGAKGMEIGGNKNIFMYGNLTTTGEIDTGLLTGTVKNFTIDHPVDPTEKILRFGVIESPRYELLYRGTTQLIDGTAIVDIDIEYNLSAGVYENLCRDGEITSLIAKDSFERVKGHFITPSSFIIESETSTFNGEVVWTVVAERCDPAVLDLSITDDDGHLINEVDKDDFDPSLLQEAEIFTKDKKKIDTEEFEQVDVKNSKGYYRNPEAYGEKTPIRKVRYKEKKTIDKKI